MSVAYSRWAKALRMKLDAEVGTRDGIDLTRVTMAIFMDELRDAADDYGNTLWADCAIETANAFTVLADALEEELTHW